MGKKVSIKNIAEELGVSNATVSLVLNGKDKKGRVSKKIADKIRETAKQMNYEPNNLARGLRSGKSHTIGLIVADISNIFFANLAFQIQEYAETFNYTVIIANTNESDEKMIKMINILNSRQVDGLIVVPTASGEVAIQNLAESRLPLVLLDRWFPNIQSSHVVIDNYEASRNAVQYLINEGCKRIALFDYNTTLPHMQERRRGYIEALQSKGLYDPNLIKGIDYTNIKEDVVEAIQDLLKNEKNVDGIFFATNSISMIGIKEMLNLKVRIPEDVAVVCFDKSDAFDFASVNIPYVLQPIPDMGRKCVDLLLEQIKGDNTVPTKIELSAKLLHTSSS